MKQKRLFCLVAILVLLIVVRWINPLGPTDEELGLLLIQAATEGDAKRAQSLMVKGADVEATGEFGRTALHKAARRRHKEIVELLLENGAKTDSSVVSLLKTSSTPLYEAAIAGDFRQVQLLIANGFNIKIKDRIGGSSGK